MKNIKFLSPSTLPDSALLPGLPISRVFLGLGIRDFRSAAQYVRDLPYGPSSRYDDSLILLREGQGNCLTKHGLIARLAAEIKLPIFRIEGFYRLNDSIVPGISATLSPFKLSWLPYNHCFLSCPWGYIDLTEGNCNGKSGLITDFLAIYAVPVEQTNLERRAMRLEFLKSILDDEPQFSKLGLEGLLSATDACQERMSAACALALS